MAGTASRKGVRPFHRPGSHRLRTLRDDDGEAQAALADRQRAGETERYEHRWRTGMSRHPAVRSHEAQAALDEADGTGARDDFSHQRVSERLKTGAMPSP
jgi:hypothetical protein